MLTLLAVGLTSGVAIGMLGPGGSIMLLVLLLMVGSSLPEAVAISMLLQLVPLTLPAAWLYYKRGHLNLVTAMWVILGALVGIVTGSWFANRISERKLGYALVVLLQVATLFMFYRYCVRDG